MTNTLTHNPLLPALFRLPLRFTPDILQRQFFAANLNYLFKDELHNHELDFLHHKVISLHITDAQLKLCFTLQQQKIKSCAVTTQADLTMQGTFYDFLLMLSRREDPDTLFFNRRLKLSGDTELGLYVKNFLDALEINERWKHLHLLSDKASRIAERF